MQDIIRYVGSRCIELMPHPQQFLFSHINKYLVKKQITELYYGKCNICGNDATFFYTAGLYRASVVCSECRSISRYRALAHGILRAIRELTGIHAESIAELPQKSKAKITIYDTQQPFTRIKSTYLIPYILNTRDWIKVYTSRYVPNKPWGAHLGGNITNQNLERLTFPDNMFNIVITSDVMEHVRLDDLAHQEIRRVLKTGGVYIFNVPCLRIYNNPEKATKVYVDVIDPADPSKDNYIQPEYHGDPNSLDGILSYRIYGTELDDYLGSLGFAVEFWKGDIKENGILDTDLYYCIKK